MIDINENSRINHHRYGNGIVLETLGAKCLVKFDSKLVIIVQARLLKKEIPVDSVKPVISV